MKLRDYGGDQPLEEFLHKFTVCAKHNEWSELEKANHLSNALVGEAAQVLWGHESGPCDSAEEIIERLTSRFGSSDQSALFQARLATRRQRKGEGLAELGQDVRTLMSKAFQGKSTQHSEAMGTKFYLDALHSKELALRVMEKEPKSLDEAIKVSLRLQAFREATTESNESYPRNTGRVQMITAKPPTYEELLQRVERLESANSKKIPSLMDDFKFTQPPRSLNQRKPRYQGNQTKCNQTKRWTAQNQKRNNNSQFNHQKRQYNQPRPQMTFANQNQNSQREEVATPRHIRNPQSAYLPVYVNDRQTLCLIDTGSSFSICPAHLVKTHEITPTDQRIVCANDSELIVCGETVLCCETHGLSFQVECLVTEEIERPILGLSFLERENVNWDFKKRQIEINGQPLPIHYQDDDHKCCRIATTKDVQVQPRYETNGDAVAILPRMNAKGELKEVKPPAETRKDVETLRSAAVRNLPPASVEDDLATPWTNVVEEKSTETRPKRKGLWPKNRNPSPLIGRNFRYAETIQHEDETRTEPAVRQPLRQRPMTLPPLNDERVEFNAMLLRNRNAFSAHNFSPNKPSPTRKPSPPDDNVMRVPYERCRTNLQKQERSKRCACAK